jgi:photosystem II stability/assembly factor-like uncharacterized protein
MATISVSPNGRNFYETRGPATELLVGTADGIVALARTGAGAPWQETSRQLRGKHIESLVVEPTRGTIFAGVNRGGLWASEDGGHSWERRDDGIASDKLFALNYVQAGDELRLYAGTEPAELYVSADFGRHWRRLPALRNVPSVTEWTFPGGDHIAHVKTIAFHPHDPNTIYVGVEVGGAFKSTDGGETFHELNEGGFHVDVHRLMVAPGRPDDVYMSTGRGIYHSTDRGEQWEKLPLPGIDGDGRSPSQGIWYPDGLVLLPQQPEVMFTAGANAAPPFWSKNGGASARVARTRDGGRTWEYPPGGFPGGRANIEAMTMNVYPGGFGLYTGTTDGDVFTSEDDGEHWTTIIAGLAPVSKGLHYRGVRPEWEPAAAR